MLPVKTGTNCLASISNFTYQTLFALFTYRKRARGIKVLSSNLIEHVTILKWNEWG